MGRPAYAPSDEERRKVKALAAYGNTQDEIAGVIGMSARSLRKHFREELDRGVVEANSQVSQSLFKEAVNGNVTAAIFWLKCRAKWRERSDPDARPTQVVAPLNITIEKEQPKTTEKEEPCKISD
jgi:hypothetical protein